VSSLEMTDKQARNLLLLLTVCSTLTFSLLAYLKYAAFTGQMMDATCYGYAFYQTLNGRFFPSFWSDGIMTQHLNFLVFAWWPVFRLAPTMYSLFLFQSLIISLAAWPVYLLAQNKTGNQLNSLLAAAGLLLFPPIVSQHVNQIHDDQFGLALLLFAFYFFEVRNFNKFAVFLVLSLLAKETIALPVASFSAYALVRRRSLKWVAFPVICSAVYLVVAWKILLPIWGGLAKQMYSRPWYFADYGQTPGQVVKYLVEHPTGIIDTMLAPDRLWYLLQLLMPLLLVLPFGNWAWLIALPNLVMNLLSSNDGMQKITWHYSVFPAALLWVSFVSAIPFWNGKFVRWVGGTDHSRSLCVGVLCACVASFILWFSPGQYHRDRAFKARHEVLALIPLNASVLCPDNMLAHFSRHRALQSVMGLRFYERDPNEVFDYDYVVFDRNFTIVAALAAQKQLFALISQMPEYQLVYSRDDVFVYQRVGTPARLLKWGKFP
jgi:uncharacterized membrane protein